MAVQGGNWRVAPFDRLVEQGEGAILLSECEVNQGESRARNVLVLRHRVQLVQKFAGTLRVSRIGGRLSHSTQYRWVVSRKRPPFFEHRHCRVVLPKLNVSASH